MTTEQIKAIIKSSGLTQREVAKRIGISYQALHSRLSAETISSTTIQDIAEALDIPISTFYNEDVSARLQKLMVENEMLKKIVEEKERTIKILLAMQEK